MELIRRNIRLLPLHFESEVNENLNQNESDGIYISKTQILLNTIPNTTFLFIISMILGTFILIIKTSFLSPPIQKTYKYYFPLSNSKRNLSYVILQYSIEKLMKQYEFLGISAQFVSSFCSLEKRVNNEFIIYSCQFKST